MRLTTTACASRSQGAIRLDGDATDLIPTPGVVITLQLASCIVLSFLRTNFTATSE